MLPIVLLASVSAQTCPVRVVRKEVSTLSEAEWNTYVSTIRLARTTPDPDFPTLSIWEYAAAVHNTVASQVHWTCLFFPWHRAFLNTVETKLRRLNSDFAFHYFDHGRIPTTTSSSVVWSRVGSPVGNPVAGDVFAGASLRQFPSTTSRPLRRQAAAAPYILNGQWSRTSYSNILQNSFDATKGPTGFTRWSRDMEVNHGHFHVSVGGTSGPSGISQMASMFSPLDPVFYMHHAFYDYMWSVAQAQWTTRKMTQISNFLANGARCTVSTLLPGYNVNIGTQLDLSRSCRSYAASPPQPSGSAAMKSAMGQAEDEELFCPPPLPESWIKMQEEGSAIKGFAETQEKLNAECHDVAARLKSGEQIPDFPVPEEKPATTNSAPSAFVNSAICLILILL